MYIFLLLCTLLVSSVTAVWQRSYDEGTDVFSLDQNYSRYHLQYNGWGSPTYLSLAVTSTDCFNFSVYSGTTLIKHYNWSLNYQNTYETDPVLYLPFENNVNDLANGTGGVNHNITFTQGMSNLSAIFNGTGSHIDLGNTNITPGSFTVMFWLNSSNNVGTQYIYEQRNAGAQNILRLVLISGGFRSMVFNSTGANTKQYLSSTSAPVNQWIHYTVTWDESLMSIYVNGTNDTSINKIIDIEHSWDALTKEHYIGRTFTHSSLLNASLDEFMVFNYSLTPLQVSSIYNQSDRLIDVTGVSGWDRNCTGNRSTYFCGYPITVRANSTCNVTIDGDLSYSSDDYFNFVPSYNNNQIFGDFSMWINYTDTSYDLPSAVLKSTLIDSVNWSMNYTFNLTPATGWLGGSTTYNVSIFQDLYNLSYSPYQLRLYFTQNGTPINVDTSIFPWNSNRMDYTNSSFVIVQANLTRGFTQVAINIHNTTNTTQYFEYYNDWNTHYNETIEIFFDPVEQLNVQIYEFSQQYLEDATVDIFTTRINGTYTNFSFNGKRMTDSLGRTYFFVDKYRYMSVCASHPDYVTLCKNIFISDVSYPYDTPLEFILIPRTYNLNDTFTWVFPNVIHNRSQIQYGSVYYNMPGVLGYMTNFSNGSGVGISSPDQIEGGRYRFTLTPGVHIPSSTSVKNFTLYMLLNSTIIGTQFVEIKDDTTFQLGNIRGQISDRMLNIIYFIALIMVSAGLGAMISSKNVSVHAFKIGAIVLSFISVQFMWITIIVVFDYLMKGIYKVVKE